MINELKEKYEALAVFPYGSSVYKNKTPEDFDFIIVTDRPYFQEQFEKNNVKYEISNYSKEEFLQRLKEHEISVLECLYIDHKDKYLDNSLRKEIESFTLDKEKLRESCSQKSSNSYVKAKKKLIVEEDFNLSVSYKSLWHSLRILDFGMQIAKTNRINPESCNDLYDNVIKDYLMMNNDWSKLHEKYKPIHNSIASEFKQICPKKIHKYK
jgi:hypothetical protein